MPLLYKPLRMNLLLQQTVSLWALMVQIEVIEGGGLSYVLKGVLHTIHEIYNERGHFIDPLCFRLARWVKVTLCKQKCKRQTVRIVQVEIGLTFLCGLILAVFKGAGTPGAPGRHLAFHRTGNMAELGGVRRNAQTQVTVYRPGS